MEGRRVWLKTKGFLTQLPMTAKIKCPGQIIIAIFCSYDELLASLLPAPQEAQNTIPCLRPREDPPLDPPVDTWQGTDSFFLHKLL